MSSGKNDLPIIQFPDRAAWDRWLDEHQATAKGAWLKIAKRSSGIATITHAQALEEAIRYGWIDGQRAAADDQFFLQRFTPRGPRSKWSQVNRRKASELIEQGRMHPAGWAQVEAAKRDGRWQDAYPPQSAIEVPEDFQRALDRAPEAAAFFATLKGAARYAFLYRLHQVKRAKNRDERISRYIELLRNGLTLQD